jgi:hypothetical protein
MAGGGLPARRHLARGSAWSCQVSIEAMNKHRAEISPYVGAGAIALRIPDGADWQSARLIGPDNIVPLPPYPPELNSVDPSTGSGHIALSARQLPRSPRP